MRVAIAGAHGKIARLLAWQLHEAGDEVVGLIRNPDHATEVQAQGARAVICDLEHATPAELAGAVEGADAVVFAAGAGPGSGPERKLTVDRDGAIALRDAARQAGVGRYVMVSAVGAERPPDDDDVFSVYLRAKAAADAALRDSDLAWTIVRPGRLTDEPPAGQISLRREPFRGEVARADVATLLAAVLHDPRSAGETLYVNGGEDPVEEALDALLRAA